MKKRLLSLLLVLCMVLPMVPLTAITVFAAADVTVTLYKEDGSTLTTIQGAYGSGVELPEYTPASGYLAGWDANGDGLVDYLPGAYVVMYNGVSSLKAIPRAALTNLPEDGMTSSFVSNFPTKNGSSVTFNGNWEVGLVKDGAYYPFINAVAPFIQSALGNPWGYGAMYHNGDDHPYCFAMGSGTDVEWRYTSYRDATVVFDFNNIFPRKEIGSTHSEYYESYIRMDFALFVNGEQKWPTNGEWYHYDCSEHECEGKEKHPAASGSHDIAAVLREAGLNTALNVKAGDVISFRATRAAKVGEVGSADNHYHNTWVLSGDPTVTFSNVDVNSTGYGSADGYSTSFSQHTPAYNFTDKGYGDTVDFSGSWSWVVHDRGNYSNVQLLDTLRNGAHNGSFNNDRFVTTTNSTGLWSSHPAIRAEDTNTDWGYKNGIALTVSNTTGIRYFAEYTGDVKIDLTQLIANANCAGSAGIYASYAVFHNGVMIWPTENGSHSDYTDWFAPTAAKEGTATTNVDATAEAQATDRYAYLASVRVEKGDSIELLAISNQTAGDRMWAHRSTLLDMKITYTDVWKADDLYIKIYNPNPTLILATNGQVTLPAYAGTGIFRGWDLDGDGEADAKAGETITITEITSVTAQVIGTYSFARDMVDYDKTTFKAILPEGWTLLARSATNFNTTMLLDTLVNRDHDMNGTSMQLGPSSGTDGWFMAADAVWNSSYPAINWLNKTDRLGGAYWGPWMGACPTTGWNAGYSYTVSYAGYVNITFDALVCDSESDRIAVFVDGVMVWPTVGGAYDNANAWKLASEGVSVDDAGLLQNLFVEEGSTIDFLVKAGDFAHATRADISVTYVSAFDADNLYIKLPNPSTTVIPATKGESVTLPKYAGTGAFIGWDANGDGKADYVDEATFTMGDQILRLTPVLVGGTSFFGNLPTWDADRNVIFQGGWQVGIYDRAGDKFLPYTGYRSPFICNYGSAWSPNPGGMYADYNAGRLAMNGCLKDGGRYMADVYYTVDKSGNITIDFNKLEIACAPNPSDPDATIAGGFALYINGQKVLPAEGDYIFYESETVYEGHKDANYPDNGALLALAYESGFPYTTDVKKGDVIEFRVVQGNTVSRMAYVDPSIVYNAVSAAPVVTATGVTVRDDYTLNIATRLNGTRTDYVASGLSWFASATDAEAKVNGTALTAISTVDNTATANGASDVAYTYAIKGLTVYDLNTTYYVRTWTEYADGTVAWSDVKEVSITGYAENALTSAAADNSLKKISAALLQYAYAVDVYLYGTSDIVLPENMTKLPTVTPENVFNLTEFDGVATIKGATLLTDPKVGIRIYVDTDYTRPLYVLVDDNASFSSPKTLRLDVSKTEDDLYYFDLDVTTAQFSDTFYFMIQDHRGDQQSEVLTYNVESYVVRAQETMPDNKELHDLLNAMLVLCKTASAFR